jgi:pimeloyl-ACP methyl ester carboxylesterase
MSTQLEHAKLEDIDSLLESQEKMVRDLRPGTEKKVLWAQGNGVKSKTSIVFIHGFSASRIEIDPVVDLIAAELNANVYFTRLRGHGQDGKALAEATYEQLLDDTIEAIEIGKTIGDDVILIGCSTGCSLIHIALAQEHNIKVAIYISPNFAPKPIKGQALRLPGAKFLVPLVFGQEHSFVAKNDEHATCWTTKYPTKALFTVKNTVLAAHQVDHQAIKVPIIMWFSDEDKVVNAKWTRRIASMMGDNVTLHNPLLTDQDDPSCHGIIGDILSPSQTTIAVKKIINWLTQI